MAILVKDPAACSVARLWGVCDSSVGNPNKRGKIACLSSPGRDDLGWCKDEFLSVLTAFRDGLGTLDLPYEKQVTVFYYRYYGQMQQRPKTFLEEYLDFDFSFWVNSEKDHSRYKMVGLILKTDREYRNGGLSQYTRRYILPMLDDVQQGKQPIPVGRRKPRSLQNAT